MRYAHGVITATWGKFDLRTCELAIDLERPVFINGQRYTPDLKPSERDVMIIIEGIDCPYDFDYPNSLDDQFGCRTAKELLRTRGIPDKLETVELGLQLDYAWEFWNPAEDQHIPFRLIADVLAKPFEIWEM